MPRPASVGLIANLEKNQAPDIARRLRTALVDGGCDVVPSPALAVTLGERDRGDEWKSADLLVCLGGDGTMLRTVRSLDHSTPAPLLGLNLGGLGFLTAVSPTEVEGFARAILEGQYRVEDRHLVRAQVEGEPDAVEGLNEAVIDEGSESRRAVVLRVSIEETVLGTFTADGLIVATPTGSTAYALSAGGPIVRPSVPALVLTAIAPHSLAIRPLVFDEQETVTVEGLLPDVALRLTMDGQDTVPVPSGRTVRIGQSPRSVRLAFLEGRTFYEILREKLNWGGLPKDR